MFLGQGIETPVKITGAFQRRVGGRLGEAAACGGGHRCGGFRCPDRHSGVVGHHGNPDPAARPGVRDHGDGGGYPGIRGENGLDLTQLDAVPPDLDLPVRSSQELDLAIRQHPAQVPGAVAAFAVSRMGEEGGPRQFLGSRVAARHAVTTDDDPADLAGRRRFVVGVEHPDSLVRECRSVGNGTGIGGHGFGDLVPVGPDGGLGCAPQGDEPGVWQGTPGAFGQPNGHPVTGEQNEPHTFVGPMASVLVLGDQQLQLGGDGVPDGHIVPGDFLQPAALIREIPGGGDDDSASRAQQAEFVEHRQVEGLPGNGQHRVGLTETVLLGHGVQGGHRLRVGDDHALRRTRRTRREDDVGNQIGIYFTRSPISRENRVNEPGVDLLEKPGAPGNLQWFLPPGGDLLRHVLQPARRPVGFHGHVGAASPQDSDVHHQLVDSRGEVDDHGGVVVALVAQPAGNVIRRGCQLPPRPGSSRVDHGHPAWLPQGVFEEGHVDSAAAAFGAFHVLRGAEGIGAVDGTRSGDTRQQFDEVRECCIQHSWFETILPAVPVDCQSPARLGELDVEQHLGSLADRGVRQGAEQPERSGTPGTDSQGGCDHHRGDETIDSLGPCSHPGNFHP